ncbi:PLP-dependent transferase, partial [Martensiomyces pterosporus]
DVPPQLKTVYLDHTGSTLYAASHVRSLMEELLTNIPSNPHSRHASSLWTHARIEQARDRLLKFFGTSAATYSLVFTANATAAIKLAGELAPIGSEEAGVGSGVFCYTQEAHTSVVGLRSLVADRGVAVRPADFGELDSVLAPENNTGTSLLAYPAQCNFSGERFPLTVADSIHKMYAPMTQEGTHPPWWVLLDAAGYASSSALRLDELEAGPDFVALSMYKIFGMPTGLGVLLIKRSSVPYLRHKRYFGGGTVGGLSFDTQWQEFRLDVESRYEDGTVNFNDIISVHHALDAHARNFGSIDDVARHTQSITQYARSTLEGLAHANGAPMCEVYSNALPSGGKQGPVIAFSLKDPAGRYIGFVEVERLAVMCGIALRTGRFCNPGATQKWLKLSTPELIRYSSMGVVCGDDHDLVDGHPVGALRISFGAMTSKQDIDLFVSFVTRHFRDYARTIGAAIDMSQESETETKVDEADDLSTDKEPIGAQVEVDQIVVYPVKSCHGWVVPRGASWEITRYGLLFDRSFVVMRENSTIPMQQKRYPAMALIRPRIDRQQGVLVLEASGHKPLEISLRADSLNLQPVETRVCGDRMDIFRVVSEGVSAWLSSVLSVSCYLACEPALLLNSGTKEGQDREEHAGLGERRDSACYARTRRGDLSFVNEAQISLVTAESAQQVESWVMEQSDTLGSTGGAKQEGGFGPMQYRPNIIVKSAVPATAPHKGRHRPLEPFAELRWTHVRLGKATLQVSGLCRRCQMIGVNQESAQVLKEPYSTLARKMRIDGKVIFG